MPSSFSLHSACWSLCSLLCTCTVRGQSVLYVWILSIFVATTSPKFFPLISHDSYSLKYYHYWASLIAQLVKNLPAMGETRFDPWVRKIPWRRYRLPTPVFLGFPGGSAGRESTCNAGDLDSIPELERLPG